jgi:hypothetical protein
MVVHAIAQACQAELSLHSFLSNIVETSMIAFFIAIPLNEIKECYEIVEHSELGHNLMRATILVPGPGLWFTKAAWDEYIEISTLVVEGQKAILERLGSSFATCSGYWSKWAH